MTYPKMLSELLDGVGITQAFEPSLQLDFTGDDCLPSCFKVTELASSSFLAAASALAEFCCVQPSIRVDNRLASLWFNHSLVARGWKIDGLWDSVAGDYRCADGWIRLHTNAPHHRQVALQILLGDANICADNTRERVAAAVLLRNKDELEQAIVNAGGCAASMRSLADWQVHAQGRAVSTEPLVHWTESALIKPVSHNAEVEKPLSGIRVLDLTRVLAGPVSTRFLAAYGADVLRIDPINWAEPAVVPEVTLGKRCAHLDLKSTDGRRHFLQLLETADVLVHGYRPGAMDNLGLSDEVLRGHNQALINVSLCAYGWQGPWANRRGFDSLVQMSCGLAHEGMRQYDSSKPYPLPVQALDHATGYLMAASALHALAIRQRTGQVLAAKLSLARTAHVLQQYPQANCSARFNPVNDADLNDDLEQTDWGPAQRVNFPVQMPGLCAAWDKPASKLRSAAARWQ